MLEHLLKMNNTSNHASQEILNRSLPLTVIHITILNNNFFYIVNNFM